ncbi:MAG: hypothetical protein RL557_527 [archaeon]|jgi:hypothetical protein
MFILYIIMERQKKFRIVRKVAKHGSQAIITIPAMLKDKLKPGTVLEVTLDVLEEVEDDSKG